jgi:hypothetical protein
MWDLRKDKKSFQALADESKRGESDARRGRVVGRFWDVVAVGFLGGSFCALIILASAYGFAFQFLWEDFERLLLFAVVSGVGSESSPFRFATTHS